MALFLHFETNPYYSEDKLRSRAASASVAQYYQRREELIREFTALEAVPGFKISPGNVQVGKAVYDFTGKTVEEVTAWLQPVIDEVACNVNLALYKVDQKRRLAADAVDGTSVSCGYFDGFEIQIADRLAA
jgi:catabolite regulation protein CreA